MTSDLRSLAARTSGAMQGRHSTGGSYPSASDDVGPCATDSRRDWVVEAIAGATEEEMEAGMGRRSSRYVGVVSHKPEPTR